MVCGMGYLILGLAAKSSNQTWDMFGPLGFMLQSDALICTKNKALVLNVDNGTCLTKIILLEGLEHTLMMHVFVLPHAFGSVISWHFGVGFHS